MPSGRLRDYARHGTDRRAWKWLAVLEPVARSRSQDPSSAIESNYTLVTIAASLKRQLDERKRHASRLRAISLTRVEEDIFPNLSVQFSLSLYRCLIKDTPSIVLVISWPTVRERTQHNRYRVSPRLATCIVIRRLATPERWR